MEKSFIYRDKSGMRLGQMVQPMRRVGIYVPGGLGAYPSSVLMNAIPAKVAGVAEIVMVRRRRPRASGSAVLAAAEIAGVDEFYRVGGAQAVAALAYGTETIKPVDKIVGPGNAFVQAAKRMVYGVADIDKMAGPSEVLVIADDRAHPEWIAADLIAQAEHGSGDEAAVLLTTSASIADRVAEAVEIALKSLPRARQVETALVKRGAHGRRPRSRTRPSTSPTRSRPSISSSTCAIRRDGCRRSRRRARFFSARLRRRRLATILRAPTTCCRPGARRVSPRLWVHTIS